MQLISSIKGEEFLGLADWLLGSKHEICSMESVSQSVSQSVGRSVSESVSQSVIHSVGQSVSQLFS